MKVNRINKVAALLLTCFSVNALSATLSNEVDGNLNVSATIAGACALTNTTNLNFGLINLLEGANANTSLTLTCAGSPSVTAIATGLHDGQTAYGEYAMSDGSNHLVGYNLYTNNTLDTSWSDTDEVSISLSGGEAILDFYGVISPQINYDGGFDLSDTVTVAVTY
jgi:spore coat protein U-like protein